MALTAADLAYVNEDGSLVYPTGPCCAWPEERNDKFVFPSEEEIKARIAAKEQKVKASLGDMAKGIVKTTIQAVKKGKLNQEDRDKRYQTCINCPSFIRESKRCSECGCFMEMKTWIAGAMCPLGKW